MKKKLIGKEPVTKDELKDILKKYPTKQEMYQMFDEQDQKFEKRFVDFKSDIFTRFDEVMGELSQIREDRIFTDHDIKVLKERSDNHEDRLKKLETS